MSLVPKRDFTQFPGADGVPAQLSIVEELGSRIEMMLEAPEADLGVHRLCDGFDFFTLRRRQKT